MSWKEKIWNDPVWSKVIANNIWAAQAFLFASLVVGIRSEGAVRTICFILVGLLFVIIILFHYLSSKANDINYGITILHPDNHSRQTSPIKVFGSYKYLPPIETVYAIVYNDITREYFPKNKLSFDPLNKQWHTIVHIGGALNQERTIIIASVGSNAMRLIQQFNIELKGIKDSSLMLNELKRYGQVKIILENN